jgi:lactate 2-monooxygenase
MLGGVQEVSMQQPWRAHTLPAPFMLAPIGVLELAHKDADLAEARACAAMKVPMIISSQASHPMEDIARQLGDCPRLFQLYYSKSKELSQSFIRRAEAIECSAIVVTLDTTLLGWRLRDLSLGYNPFIMGKGIAQYYSDPVFNALPNPVIADAAKPPVTLDLIRNMISLNNRIPGGFMQNLTSGKAMKTARKFTTIFNNPGITWEDIKLIRQWTKLPIYLKGILRADDAITASAIGVDGIIISNHGGRQIDGAVSSVEALPSVLSAVKGKLEVWLDSGIRSGSDVYKCIALGATGVMIGRPYAMALACNGEEGIIDCLNNIMSELELHMALSGCHTINDINQDLISHPWKTT